MYGQPRMWQAVSALQKCVRRGLERDAMYWFLEIERCGGMAIGLNRLRIISHEDVGLADPQVVMFVASSADTCERLYKAKNDGWHLMAANAVLAMCRAKKTRLADHFQAAVRAAVENGEQWPVPDVAIDRHTAQGRQMGRGVRHFVDEGAKLSNHQPMPLVAAEDARLELSDDPYAAEAEAYWLAKEAASGGRRNGHVDAEGPASSSEGLF